MTAGPEKMPAGTDAPQLLDGRGVSMQVHPEASAILNLDPSLVRDFIGSALREHARLLAEGSVPVLKNAPESAVTLVDMPGQRRVCVKELRWRGYLHALKGFFRPSQGVRTFRNGRRLRESGIAAAAPLALVREIRCGVTCREWVVMEAVTAALELDRFVVRRVSSGWSAEEKRGLVRLFGRFIGAMHARGVFHSDLKTCNIQVVEERHAPLPESDSFPEHQQRPASSTRFVLLDYDDVTFSREVPPRRRVKNLVQIFLSTPIAIEAASRMRFLGEYALRLGINAAQKRQTARFVLDRARGRHILYVGLDGDVIEEWERNKDSPRVDVAE